jgi:hypothetical protein
MLSSMRSIAILALVLGTAVAACGGADDSPPPASWGGLQRPYPADGVLPVDEFRAYAESLEADWERDPKALARAYTQVTDGTVTLDDGRVTLLRDSLEDDSVRAERYVLDVERANDVWTLVRARWEQRCHEQRGHQEFSPELCV